ncbi:MAG: TRAP transporter small permease [Rhodocyclaceae bacterium]|nr:MAG: TRAP transporter small permease [Rhodocyclaceae bacterium]
MSAMPLGQRVYRVCQNVGTVSAIAIMLITVTDVALRYLFNKAIFGSSEIVNAALVILVCSGMGAASGLGNHIRVDLLDPTLSGLFRHWHSRWVYAWELLGTMGFAILLASHAWRTVEERELTPVLEFSMGYVFLTGAVLVLGAVVIFVGSWREFPPGEPSE